MATIGTFKKTGSNEFTGEIVTLSVQAKGVRIVPDQRATVSVRRTRPCSDFPDLQSMGSHSGDGAH